MRGRDTLPGGKRGGNGGKGDTIARLLGIVAKQEEFPRLSKELKQMTPAQLERLGDMLNQELIKIEKITEREDVIIGGESGVDITDSELLD